MLNLKNNLKNHSKKYIVGLLIAGASAYFYHHFNYVENQYNSYIKQGDTLLQQEQYEKAKEAYKKANEFSQFESPVNDKINNVDVVKSKNDEQDKQEKIKQEKQKIANLIQNGNYEEAFKLLSEEKKIGNVDDEFNALEKYAEYKSDSQSGGEMGMPALMDLDSLPVSYTGIMSDAIHNARLRLNDPKIKNIIEQNKAFEFKMSHSKPEIGMNIDQVHIIWGLPNHVNTTSTAYGDSYQLVWTDYNGLPYRYIYMEGDKVTAVQEEK